MRDAYTDEAGVASYLGWDTETDLITATNIAPDPVCYQLAGIPETFPALKEFVESKGWAAGQEFLLTSWHVGSRGVRYGEPGLGPHARAGKVTSGWVILVIAECALEIHTWAMTMANDGHRLVAHNAPYDWGVLCKAHPELVPYAFHAIEQKWSTDTMVREKLYCVATDNYKFDRRIQQSRSSGSEEEGGAFPLHQLVLIHFGEDISDGKHRLRDLIDKGIPREQWPWRYRYSELKDVPLSQWPVEAVYYAMGDAVEALRVAVAQSDTLVIPEGSVCVNGEYVDEFAQVAADWALHLVSCTGVPVDPEAVAIFGQRVEEEAAKSVAAATSYGFRKVNKCRTCAPGGKADMGTGWYGEVPSLIRCPACNGDPSYMPPRCRIPLPDDKRGNCKARLEAWVTYAYGGEPPRNEPTDKMREKGILRGSIKTGREVCEFSGEKRLMEYAEGLAAEKLRNTYLKFLRVAALEGTLHTSFNVLLRSGRTSSYKPNNQNPPRIGGYRECFVAPVDHVFGSLDFASQEMATLAQVCINLFGQSSLADAINEDLDPHLWFALRLLHTDGLRLEYDEAYAILQDKSHPLYKRVKYWRQVAKVCDFGYPGGLGSNTFVDYARGYGLTLSPNESNEYRKAYFKQWPMVDRYLNRYLRKLAKGPEGHRFAVRQHHTGRIRGGCTFTSAANTYFQGLAADGTKYALWNVVKAQYTDPSSPLWGTRTWNVIHDELLLVGLEETAHEWAYEASRIMVSSMERLTPDVKHKVEPALMRRWYKDADTVHDSNGRLIPWSPPTPGD